jgi:hypothetical protein
MPATAIGFLINRYGPLQTKIGAVAVGKGVPFPRDDMAQALQSPNKDAIEKIATEAGF